MPTVKLICVSYYDHYSSDLPHENYCIAFCCGIEANEQNNEYLRLIHIKADFEEPQSAQEHHNILRAAIIHKEELEIDLAKFTP